MLTISARAVCPLSVIDRETNLCDTPKAAPVCGGRVIHRTGGLAAEVVRIWKSYLETQSEFYEDSKRFAAKNGIC